MNRQELLVALRARHIDVPVGATVAQLRVLLSNALEEYFDYYARPRRIISDRGTAFTSREFARFLDERNICHVKVAVASPQANGQVERVNRVLKNVLGKLTEPVEHSNWVHMLSYVQYAINNTVHRSIKQTPSKLLFGVEQRGKIVDELTEHLTEKFAAENAIDLQCIRADAGKAIDQSQQYNEEYFLRNSKPAKTFEVGDYIVVRHVDTTVGSNKKLLPNFRGPYVIKKKLPHDRYLVTDIENSQITQMPYNGIVEAKRIRHWIGRQLSGASSERKATL